MNIVLDEANSLVSSLDTFKSRLAKKPYCSDDLGYGVQIRDKMTALSKKYIQANTPWSKTCITFDVDYPFVLETTFKEKILPTPNIVIINPTNFHSHLLYCIKTGVHLSNNASIDAIKYAHAVEYSLREELKADNGYSGLIIKNPVHEYWETLELNENLWSLGELAEYLTLPKKIPKRESLIGLGRNCTLFELGRKYAYSEVLKQKIIGTTKDGFYRIILDFIEQQNQDFPNPLMFNEYKGIAKSISNWTWKHYGDKTTKQWAMYVKKTHSVEIQTYRGRLGGLANTKEQQSIKGKLGGLANTSEQQALKGKANSKEKQSMKGIIGGKNNTIEQQSLKGQKSGRVRYEGSNEQTKPWEALGISRRTYYYRQQKGLI